MGDLGQGTSLLPGLQNGDNCGAGKTGEERNQLLHEDRIELSKYLFTSRNQHKLMCAHWVDRLLPKAREVHVQKVRGAQFSKSFSSV